MAKARIGAKLVKTLPRLDDRRRQAYRGQFTDAQCRAWGARTWAATVLGEAERAIGSAARLIAKAEVPGYPKQRLAWLAELLVELEASIAQDDLPTQKRIRAEARGRAEAVDRLRRQLVAALQRLAPADAAYLRRVSALNVSNPAPQRLVQTLVGLVRLARQQRSTDDARLLADDCGLTEALLEQVEAEAASLEEAVSETFSQQLTNDSLQTSAVEGRVLRELAFLHDAIASARETGVAIDALPLPRSVRSASRRKAGAARRKD